MRGKSISVATPKGQFSAYLALPAGSAPKAAVVAIQEIFGVNQVMRDICDAYAAQGFMAICPDLFWRIEPGIELTDKTEAEWKRALSLMSQFDIDCGVEDIEATIDHARAELGAPKVGAIGFCLGGQLAFLTATRTDSDATIGYYGTNIQQRLEEAEKLARPLMLHIAGKDDFVLKPAQEAIKAALKNHPLVTLYCYEEQSHAFARKGGVHYDRHAAELADARSLAFLRHHLLS